MEPELSPQPFAYRTLSDEPLALPPEAFALIREDEGLTLIEPGEGWARITLTIHSSLEAVGLTAAISQALGRRSISANVVAAYYHDHVFVPWDRREEALEVLRKLGERDE